MDLFKYESLHMSPAQVFGWTREGDYSPVTNSFIIRLTQVHTICIKLKSLQNYTSRAGWTIDRSCRTFRTHLDQCGNMAINIYNGGRN